MKKFLLPAVLFLTLFTSGQVYAQARRPLTCEESEKIRDSKECPHWTIRELGLWCAQSFEELVQEGAEPVWRIRPPDYTLLSDSLSCGGEEGAQDDTPLLPMPTSWSNQGQPDKSKRQTIIQFIEEEGKISWVRIFGINPFEAWLNVQHFIKGAVALKGLNKFSEYSLSQLGSGTMYENAEKRKEETLFKTIHEKNWEKILNREPSISPALENESWEYETEELSIPSPSNAPEVTIVKGQGQLAPDDFYEKVITIDSVDEQLGYATVTVFSEGTSKKATLRYTWGANSGAVMNIFPQAEIKFIEPVQDKKTQELKRMVKLNKGELEIKVKQAHEKAKFGIQTDFLDLYVIGTHFWVTHDPDRKFTLVGVYDGTVAVTTKDGKTTTVSPNGDKPGIVAVTQKLSITKLVFAGSVLVAIIGGTVFFLKRKKKK